MAGNNIMEGMDERLLWQRGVLLSLLIFVTGGLWFDMVAYESTSGYLAVHFLDVGQGDATLIESPDGIDVLIDGGPDAGVLRELSRELGFFDRTIDVLVATHPDGDHIGGLIDVLERYEVSTVVLTENENDTPTAAAFAAAVTAEGAEVVYARAGASLSLGASTTLEFLFPDRNPAGFESNASSIIAQLQYGEIEFMLTGDAPKSIEEYLVREQGAELESEVLKVGHHGSDTSTADSFLSTVSPQFAVISAGADNRYGHPHEAVLNRLTCTHKCGGRTSTFQAPTILETAELGTISFMSDGNQVWHLE